uniref:Copper transport protein n=1 Tax=Panagrellus redivivus TaxID=6233 RepID=A0A7E4ZWH0_PANRE
MSHDHAGHEMSNMDHGAMDHGSAAMDSGAHDHMGMGMAMYYHFSSMETILFKFWNTKSPIGIVISFIIVVLFCFLHEAIKWTRLSWRKKVADATAAANADQHNDESAPTHGRAISCPMVGDFVLHAAQLFLSYSLMMIFMTFNVWLCAAVVLGEASAHLFFRVMLPGLDRAAGWHSVASASCG